MLTVTVPAATRALTTEAAVRAELGAGGGAPSSARVVELIAAASAAIDSHCNRVFARETVREEVDLRHCTSRGNIALRRRPVVAIVAVAELNGDPFTAYRCNLESGVLSPPLDGSWRGAWTAWGPQLLTVDYTTGWLLPSDVGRDLPADVERAAVLTVCAWLAGTGRDPMLRSETVEGVGAASWVATDSTGALPPQAADMLYRYRSTLG